MEIIEQRENLIERVLDNLLSVNKIILYEFCKNNDFKKKLRPYYHTIENKLTEICPFEEDSIQKIQHKWKLVRDLQDKQKKRNTREEMEKKAKLLAQLKKQKKKERRMRQIQKIKKFRKAEKRLKQISN